MTGIRLQKYLSEAGVSSRRAGEALILAGRIAVNGEVVRQLGTRIDPTRDRVALDGAPLKTRRKLYVALNKPAGYLCSRSDPQKRRSVMDLLPREWSNLYPVGRLDADTEGLLLLTNDGDFCLRLTHPRYGVAKLYRATLEGRVEESALRRIEQGVNDRGEDLRAARARLLSANNSHSLVEVEMTEGKYREVRRLFEVIGLTVAHLRRVQVGRIKLGDLPAGRWRTLSAPEVASLLKHPR